MLAHLAIRLVPYSSPAWRVNALNAFLSAISGCFLSAAAHKYDKAQGLKNIYSSLNGFLTFIESVVISAAACLPLCCSA